MKTKIILLFISLSLFSTAQTTTKCNVQLSLTKALTVVERIPLSFGKLVMAGAGTATVSVGGVASTDGLVTQSGSVSPCVVDLTGVASSTVMVSIPTSTPVSNGVTTLYVTEFNCSSPTNILQLDGNGKHCATIGAMVTVPQTATMGEYTGEFELTFNYQ